MSKNNFLFLPSGESKLFNIQLKIIICLISILLLSNFQTLAQDTLPRYVLKENYQTQENSLKNSYAKNKILPDSFKIQTLIALSQYPELIKTPIEFKEKRIATTMVTRPKPNFIFKNKKNREYVIYINNSTKRIKGVLLDTVPFNAQVGIIGHELGHVVDFSDKSTFTILGNGIAYMFGNWRRKFEYSIDQIAIQHGFVWQLYDFSDFILNKSFASEKYKKYKRENYMSPNQILKYHNDIINNFYLK